MVSNWNNGEFDVRTDLGRIWEGSGRGLNSSMTVGFKFQQVTWMEVYQIYRTLKFLHNCTLHRDVH
jgi:hypothetical protein